MRQWDSNGNLIDAFTLTGSNGQKATVTNGKLDVNATATATFADKYEVLVTRQTDFAGKTAAQTWDVPHVSNFGNRNTFDPPASYTTELSQPNYNAIASQDGSLFSPGSTTSGVYGQNRFMYDLYTTAKRTPGVSSSMTVAEFKALLKSITITVMCYGVGVNATVSTNGIKVKVYNNTTAAWDLASGHSLGVLSTVTINIVSNFSDYIDSSGKIAVLCHAEFPADGTIASQANIDYSKIDMTLAANALNDTGFAMNDEQQLTGATVTAGATTAAWSNVDTSRCDEYAVAVSPSTSHTYSVAGAAVGRDNVELEASTDRAVLIASASQSKKRAARTKVPSRKVNIYVTNGDVSDRTYYGRFLRYGVRGERQS